jgi:hypothetical protein
MFEEGHFPGKLLFPRQTENKERAPMQITPHDRLIRYGQLLQET